MEKVWKNCWGLRRIWENISALSLQQRMEVYLSGQICLLTGTMKMHRQQPTVEPEVQLFRFEKYERLYEDLNEEEKKEQDHFIYNGLKYAHKVIDTRQCDMVVLDEVLGLLDLGLLKTEELVEMLENRSDDQTIIMTGRQIPEALIPYADAVYEISTIKES